jgi:hypothetical protein
LMSDMLLMNASGIHSLISLKRRTASRLRMTQPRK